jgi:PIN domain nuclease of toxin-antitoxin system
VTAAPVLDTHAWIWWIAQDNRLGRSSIAALDSLPPDERPFLCDISLWEVATLLEKRRIGFAIPFEQWLDAAAHPRTVRLLTITSAIAAELAVLPKSFHRDPADRVIVATCRVMKLPLLTRDTLILRSRLATRWKP